MFVYQPTFNTMKKKKTTLNISLIGNEKGYIILNLRHYMVLYYLT